MMQQFRTHFDVVAETEYLLRRSQIQINKAYKQLGDDVQTVNEVAKFVSNKTMGDIKLLGIKERTNFIMSARQVNVNHKLY